MRVCVWGGGGGGGGGHAFGYVKVGECVCMMGKCVWWVGVCVWRRECSV